MEDKCTDLSTSVDNLNSQLERSLRNENELREKMSDLSRTLTQTSSSSKGMHDQIASLQRALNNAENEKQV